MKHLILILFISAFRLVNAQLDKFKFNANLSFETVNYTYDEIRNNGITYYNGIPLNSPFYSRFITRYECLNIMAHFGVHVPFIVKNSWSLGIKPTIGYGRLFNYKDPIIRKNDVPQQINNDELYIKSSSIDAQACLYLRYNLENKTTLYGHISIFGGCRYLNSYDNYAMPVFGIEYGQEMWGIDITGYFTRINYYRQLSNGDIEVAKRIYDIASLTAHIYFSR